MMEARCKNNMCTRLYMPLLLTFAKTIHTFQGATVGPAPPGRPENTFLHIVADPGTRQFESGTNGLFYTLLSRVTTIGDMKDPTTSAIALTGSNMNVNQIKKTNKKRDGDYYENVKQLHKWVKYLDDHEMYIASKIEIQNMVEWTNDMMNKPVDKKQLARVRVEVKVRIRVRVRLGARVR